MKIVAWALALSLGALLTVPLAVVLFFTTLEGENIGNYAQVVNSGTSMQVFLNTLRIAAIDPEEVCHGRAS